MTEYVTTSRPVDTRSRLRLWPVCKWLIMSMALIVAAGAMFQLLMRQWESYRYPPPGKLVDIGGLRLHINCTGPGSPTVIMDSGLGDTSVIWQLVQPEVSRFTRVCSYDRAGLGWSDAPNEPRASSSIANELYRLLTRAIVPAPYVLVGSSSGGYSIRVFASRYRKQVVGMVLVDSTYPDQLNRPPFGINGHLKWEYEKMISNYYKVGISTMPLGLRRILGWCHDDYIISGKALSVTSLISVCRMTYPPPEYRGIVPSTTSTRIGSVFAGFSPFKICATVEIGSWEA